MSYALTNKENFKSSLGKLNKHLVEMEADYLYHLDLSSSSNDLPKMFGDVKFICMGGSSKRMLKFANYIKDLFGIQYPTGYKFENFSEGSDRYSMYKVGPILSVSHGIGCPSLSILLNELIKLIHYAGCQDVIFFRLGTSGGLGIEPGSIVLTTEAVDGLFRPAYTTFVLGKERTRETKCDESIIKDIVDLNETLDKKFNIVTGKTMCAHDFYEGQARIDGVFCDFTEDEKLEFLNKCKKEGIVNFEMESLGFAGILSQANLKFGIICVTLLDRMNGDQLSTSHELLTDYAERPFRIVSQFIKKHLNNNI